MTHSGFTLFLKDSELTTFHNENYDTVYEYLGKSVSLGKFVKGLCLIGALRENADTRESAVRGISAMLDHILTDYAAKVYSRML